MYIGSQEKSSQSFLFLIVLRNAITPLEEEIEVIVKKEAKVDESLHENFEDKAVDVVAEHCVNYCNKHRIENPGRNFTNRSETNCHRKSTKCELFYSLFRG